MDFIQILVVVVMCLSGLNLLFMPFVIGRPRPAYRQKDLTANAIELIIFSIFALRILGKI